MTADALSTTLRRSLTALALGLSVTACADYTSQNRPVTVSGEAPEDIRDVNADPWEGFNRAMFRVNQALDTVIIRPLAYVYRSVVPDPGRKAVSNVLSNLGEPVDFFNSVFQGDVQNSFATFWRFAINTTVGIGGINDVATSAGLTARDADFGQTLALCGVNSGPYLYLPFFGPSTVRDAGGRGVDIALDPLTYTGGDWEWVSYARGGATAIDFRAQNMKLIDDINRTSLDPYVTYRSVFLQRRTAEIAKARLREVPRKGEDVASDSMRPSLPASPNANDAK